MAFGQRLIKEIPYAFHDTVADYTQKALEDVALDYVSEQGGMVRTLVECCV